jgi:hypothetical protein
MALVTTILTTPILNLIGVEDHSKKPQDMAVLEAA